jgi:hypothetical protein
MSIFISFLMLFLASFNISAAVTACPSGWTKSADGSECVLETKTTQTPNQVTNTAKPVCISGFNYSSTSMKCEQINNASTYSSYKQYQYLSGLRFGPNPQEADFCSNYSGTQTSCPLGNNCSGGYCGCKPGYQQANGNECAYCPQFTAFNKATNTCWGSQDIFTAYQYFFDRQPELVGLTYWYYDLNSASRYRLTTSIYNGAQNSDISTSRSKMTNGSGVNAIYMTLFNRSASISEQNYWVSEFSRLGILGDGLRMIDTLYYGATGYDAIAKNQQISIINVPAQYY